MNNVFLPFFACILSTAFGCQEAINFRYLTETSETARSEWCGDSSCGKNNLKIIPVIDTQTLTCSKVEVNRRLNYTYQYAEHHHLVIADSDLAEIPKNSFLSDFEHFDKLTLKNLQIENISNGALDDFNLLEELDLSYNRFVSVPEEILKLAGLNLLDLSNNKLENISEVDFSALVNLKFLYLRKNYIGEVSSTVFENLTALYEIDLSGNPLVTLGYAKSKTIKNLVATDTYLEVLYYSSYGGLNVVDLSNNRFQDLDWFSYLECRQLVLSHNNITSLYSIPKLLHYLDLSHNKISEIVLPRRMSYLESLSLSFNNISEIKPCTFSDLDHLVFLDLSHNSLKVLNEDIFCGCHLLKTVDLSSNSLSYVYKNVFKNVPHLTTLDLSGNKLKNLNLLMLPRENSVKYLLISNNKIASLNVDLFKEVISNLESIALNGNVWYCDDLAHILDTFKVWNNIYITDASSYNVKNNVNGIACKL